HLPQVDSLVIDPHKQGLQPYGCGCVIFRDPAVSTLYRHDSPYTYYTGGGGHLGEITLECSRAGAAAAALWLTQQCIPLATQMRDILRQTRQAALDLANGLQQSSTYTLYLPPTLDIVTYFPKAD